MKTAKAISYPNSINLLNFLKSQEFTYELDFKKNHFKMFNKEYEKIVQFNYPLIINITESLINDKDFLKKVRFQDPAFTVMLIQTGYAALGLCKEGKLVHHKMIRKYITRKKQGKSQLKYLKTKGKSRAGSRIRLSNAVMFFEEINIMLSEWAEGEKADSIIYSCTPMLWGMLYQSKTKPPFVKKDERLKKLPINSGLPNTEALKKAISYCQNGYVFVSPVCPAKLSEEIESFIHSPRE